MGPVLVPAVGLVRNLLVHSARPISNATHWQQRLPMSFFINAENSYAPQHMYVRRFYYGHAPYGYGPLVCAS
jgi:hypothetical protein